MLRMKTKTASSLLFHPPSKTCSTIYKLILSIIHIIYNITIYHIRYIVLHLPIVYKTIIKKFEFTFYFRVNVFFKHVSSAEKHEYWIKSWKFELIHEAMANPHNIESIIFLRGLVKEI